MKLTFRAKIGAIVGIAALAFLLLIAVETFLTRAVEQRLSEIREVYLPTLELGPKLTIQLERLRRGFQDSVAAQDKDLLNDMRRVKEDFLSAIEAARNIISMDRKFELNEATDEYFDAAFDVSRRMIAGETGLSLVNRIHDMQGRQAALEALVAKATSFDRSHLVDAFIAVEETERTSGRLLLIVSIACLTIVGSMSFALSRSVFRSLLSVSNGLKRFGLGDFDHPIRIQAKDELGELATEANQMAVRIKGLIRELDSFSYSVAHDLRAPVRSILGFSTIVLEEQGPSLPQDAHEHLGRVVSSARKMGELIDSLLNLSRIARTELKFTAVDLSDMSREILAELQASQPDRKVTLQIRDGILASGDRQLLHVVLTNLLSNAWKFTSKRDGARIEFGVLEDRVRGRVHFVRDNGAGFDMSHASKLFGTFQRLHASSEFDGNGVGLATVQTIVHRHGGEIWADGERECGATFYFTIRGASPTPPGSNKPA